MAPITLKPPRLDDSFLESIPERWYKLGFRFELLDGELFVTASPRIRHQRVVKRLARQLEDYFEARGIGEVFGLVVDVQLSRHDTVEPDIVVVTDPAQCTELRIEGAPALHVEVLSPSTTRRDRGLKAERYALHGVTHYWIVDPVQRTVECLQLQNGEYVPRATVRGDDRLEDPAWPGLVVDLARVWA